MVFYLKKKESEAYTPDVSAGLVGLLNVSFGLSIHVIKLQFMFGNINFPKLPIQEFKLKLKRRPKQMSLQKTRLQVPMAIQKKKKK